LCYIETATRKLSDGVAFETSVATSRRRSAALPARANQPRHPIGIVLVGLVALRLERRMHVARLELCSIIPA
jgi:hypothetical protein